MNTYFEEQMRTTASKELTHKMSNLAQFNKHFHLIIKYVPK